MPSAQKKTRSPSNAQTNVDSQSSKLASATSPITGKPEIPTSADSGWGEADSNVGSPQAGPSRTRAQSSNRSNQANPVAASLPSNSNAENQGTSAIASNPDSSVTSSSQPSAPSEQPKESSGPPKVNIWQVRREEAAKKAAAQEKLKKEQEALQKHQQSTDVAQTKQKNEDSAASSPTASKGGKKKRDSANPQNASTPASTPAPGNKGKESNRKASGNKPTSKVSSSTSRQVSQQSVNAAKAGSGTEQAVVNTASASDWPSPSEEKDREAAESQKKPQSVRGNEDTAPSNQASVEAGTSSPSRSKKRELHGRAEAISQDRWSYIRMANICFLDRNMEDDTA